MRFDDYSPDHHSPACSLEGCKYLWASLRSDNSLGTAGHHWKVVLDVAAEPVADARAVDSLNLKTDWVPERFVVDKDDDELDEDDTPDEPSDWNAVGSSATAATDWKATHRRTALDDSNAVNDTDDVGEVKDNSNVAPDSFPIRDKDILSKQN